MGKIKYGIELAKKMEVLLAKQDASVLTRIGKRLGISDFSVPGIMKQIRDNPVTTAMVAWEIGDAAQSIMDELSTDDSASTILEALQNSLKNDDSPDKALSLGTLSAYSDEMDCIDRAARAIGGMAQLLNLRRALTMDDNFYVLREQLRVLGRR